jgi:hypothetical protein
MRGNEEGSGRRKLTGLVVGAAVLLAAAPVLALDDSTSTQEAGEVGRANAPEGNAPAASLNIGYFDRADVPVEVAAAMQSEVERLIGELGVAVASLDGETLTSNQNHPGGRLLNVVVWEQLPETWPLPPNTMGVCPDSGSMPHNVYVFAPNVLNELGLRSEGVDGLRAEDVGRAFGRVVTHEIIHAFATLAGEHRHRGNGLMGEGLDRETLLRPGISVDERSGEAFRAGLLKAAEIG